jgi:hypothetical protein
MADTSTLDEKIVNQYHTLVKDIQGIQKDSISKTLMDIINEEAQTFYLKNRDKEKGSLKFKDDNQKRELATNIWDKAADHIAKTYLKMNDQQIKDMKKLGKDKDGNNIWEAFMSPYLGATKDSFFDSLDSIAEIDPRTIYSHLIEPLYKNHINYRTSSKVKNVIKTTEDANNVIKYLKLAKEHLPDTLSSYKAPSKFKDTNEIAQHFVSVVPLLPDTYHPYKRDTHQKKYAP